MNHLRSAKDARAYLNASADGPDAFVAALGAIVRAGSVTTLAKHAGLSREGIYKGLSGKGNPSFKNVGKIMQTMGYTLTVASAR